MFRLRVLGGFALDGTSGAAAPVFPNASCGSIRPSSHPTSSSSPRPCPRVAPRTPSASMLAPLLEVVFLKDAAAMENFKKGKLKLDAQASAVALTARAAADLAYRSGVAIVTMAKGGLMYEASVGGQKFSFKPTGKD